MLYSGSLWCFLPLSVILKQLLLDFWSEKEESGISFDSKSGVIYFGC